MGINYASVIAFVIGLGCIVVYSFFLFPKQLQEAVQPYDWLTKLRFIILAILVISIATSIPGIIYQYGRIFNHEYSLLRNVSTVTTNISKLSTTVLLVLVYTYRKRDD